MLMRNCFYLLMIVLCLGVTTDVASQAASTPTVKAGYIEEYYYKVKWGFAEEFMTLFKKNHYPLLVKQQEMGRIVSFKIEAPTFHATEDSRWDFRVTVVWKDRNTPFDESFDSKQLIANIYPDQVTFKKEEQRRFELLIAHWDVAISPVRL